MTATKPSIINEPATTASPRCQHRTLKGRCRQLATDPARTLCFDHARAEQQAKNDFTLLAPLVRKAKTFSPPKPSTKRSALSTTSSPRAAFPLGAPPSSPTSTASSCEPSRPWPKKMTTHQSSSTCPATAIDRTVIDPSAIQTSRRLLRNLARVPPSRYFTHDSTFATGRCPHARVVLEPVSSYNMSTQIGEGLRP